MGTSGQVRAFTMVGTQAVPVIVRAEAAAGPSAVTVGGGLDRAAGERTAGILRACGLDLLPALRIDIRPPHLAVAREVELAVALALLVAGGALRQQCLDRSVAFAELSPGGDVEPADGIEAVAIQTEARGLVLLCAACQAGGAGRAGRGMAVGLPDLAGAVAHLEGQAAPAPGFAEQSSPPVIPVVPLGAAGPAPETPPDPVFASTGPYGHRGRMRERVLMRGTGSLADYELLEMLLFLAIGRGDTKPLAKALINCFGAFGGVLCAPSRRLLAVPGVNAHVATALAVVREAAERLTRAEVADRPLLNNWDRLIDYLTVVLAREPVEQFRVLFLDTRNRLLADEAQARGTVNHTPVYPREVVRRALEVQATALILVHNHPSGDPTPSRDDVEMTRQVREAAAALGILLHDHLIIGAGRWLSFRREGLL